MEHVEKARVFKNGRSQAVRIPARFRFTTDEVFIRRDEKTGALTLSEKPARSTMAELFARIDAEGGFDFELDRETRPAEEREEW